MLKLTTLRDAQVFVLAAHHNQKYGDQPYYVHLQDTYKVLIEHKEYDYDLCMAAFLHDVLEDTDITYEYLVEVFGEKIANIVRAVTDEPGKNRKERKAKTYPKIKAFGEQAIIIKLADRIANVRSCFATKNLDLLSMYMKEHSAFLTLYNESHTNAMPLWKTLNIDLIAKGLEAIANDTLDKTSVL